MARRTYAMLGSDLDPRDQREVLNSYVHRMTTEARRRWPDHARRMLDGGYRMPEISDAEWLRRTYFAVTKNGRLDGRRRSTIQKYEADVILGAGRKPNPRMRKRTRNFASGWRGIRNLPNNYPLTTGSSNAWARNPAAVRKAAGIYGKRWVVEDFAGIRRLYVHKTNVRTYVLTETERLSLDDMVAINGQYHFPTLKDLKAALVKAERGRTPNRRKNPRRTKRKSR